ncbi:hypothetical protein ACHAXT_010169 [Thalassiosira profunda]
MLAVTTATPALAIEGTASATTFATGNFDCLLDLPPVTQGCVRMYLCRHGQTENNLLKKVQGARVDPPINQNGQEQAQRTGLAVYRLLKSSRDRAAVPTLAVHSKLRRAKETAQLLTTTANSQSTRGNGPTIKIYGELSSLGEVDFGAFEGQPDKVFQKARRETFASWSIGNIDKRTGGGGESGREVLERAAVSLDELSKLAASLSPPSSILAVSHSTYLRVLLSMVNDSPLAESALWQIQNGSINVIDVNIEGKTRRVTSNSGIFGGKIVGKLRRSDNGLNLEIPECRLIRRNEVRQLEGMTA